ncbi:MAG: hypothetical protein DMF93_24265 [Acidobacteria bacterium]|nr:MAG: hypothetical protein DMF93_24265 [Acidobacteriota bacterium]
MTSRVIGTTAAVLVLVLGAALLAQGGRPASPAGSSATQVGGKYDTSGAEPVYKGGKWIEITYGRPIKRGRKLFAGAGESYGKTVNPDAPVWRAGANVSTQLKTEVPLAINGKTIAPGTYTMFIDLKPNNWTLIVSNWKAATTFNPQNDAATTGEVFGAYGYTPDKDVVRAPMKVATLPFAVDQLTWEFTDVSDAGGSLTIMWDTVAASVPFKVQM